jgi:hypothetical protein
MASLPGRWCSARVVVTRSHQTCRESPLLFQLQYRSGHPPPPTRACAFSLTAKHGIFSTRGLLCSPHGLPHTHTPTHSLTDLRTRLLACSLPAHVLATCTLASRRVSAVGSVRIGMIGDSITAGVHSSGGNHTYVGRSPALPSPLHHPPVHTHTLSLSLSVLTHVSYRRTLATHTVMST